MLIADWSQLHQFIDLRPSHFHRLDDVVAACVKSIYKIRVIVVMLNLFAYNIVDCHLIIGESTTEICQPSIKTQ